MTRASGGFQPYVSDPSVCCSQRVGELHAYWRSLCRDGLLPARRDVEPTDIKALLPNILLMDIEQDPLRVRYRLVGTAIAELSRRDITGLYLDEIRFDEPRERSIFEAGYRLLLATRAPVFGRILWLARADMTLTYESAIFPLAGDGRTIDKAIAVEHYLDVDPREVAERVPSRPSRDER
ncbi:PAS domain-containing protein [Tistlia consotensis]|uniref:PAS domain-containing protein n=1 Tax=Tistlia consotensis USBA 355 TaxID=560819 RepID=A0A1Y6BZA1_9PROT|nr:PAS domain-containing protein [Tistlia consotensis]SMF33101.1 PAS domain-containing protein [Tistlia consotensis USBA 355]SNR69336.1 PAS domain-containing protein [Tistlia consotensis]